MKTTTLLLRRALLFCVFLLGVVGLSWGQSAGFNNTFILLSLNGGATTHYDLNATTANPNFQGANLGTFGVGTTNLVFKGAEHNVYKCNGADLTSTRLYYRIYLTGSSQPTFVSNNIGYTSTFANSCGGQDQVWSNSGYTTNLLSGLAPGNYTFQVYSDASITCCGGTAFASNSGNNYTATFTVSSTNYYSKTSGNLELITSWGTNTDGTGANPPNFTSNYCTYNIRNNAAPTIGASWTVSGTGSKIVVGDGTNACNFTVPSTLTVTSPTTEVVNNGIITRTTSVANSWGTLSFASGATYVHNASGGTLPTATWNANSTLQIDADLADDEFTETFGNVTINGSSEVRMMTTVGNNTCTIQGNLTVNSTGIVVVGQTNTTDQTLTINGNLLISSVSGNFYVESNNTSLNYFKKVIVLGNYIQTSGNLNIASNTGASVGPNERNSTLEVRGDFTHTGGTITESAADPDYRCQILLSKTSGTQSIESVGNMTGLIEFNVAGSGAQCVVPATKTFIQSGNQPTFIVANGSSSVDLNILGTFRRTSANAMTINASAVAQCGAGGTYEHAVNGSSLPTISWNPNSTFLVTGITSSNSFSSGAVQSYGNVTWNCPNQTSFFSFGGITTINGNLSIQSTGASPSSTSSFLLTNSPAITTTIAGNLTISGGFFAPFGALTESSSTLNISGNLSISGGTFDIYRPAANTGTINMAGDFSMTAGTLTKGGAGTGNFNFSKTGTQTYTKSGGTISNAINFTVNSGSTLSMGTNILDGSTCTFTLSSGAGLITANTEGITTTGSTGTIQVSGARTYNIGANYTFNGSSAQVTGAGFSGANNLTINNSAGVTLSGNASLAGTLTLTSGAFTVGSGNTITVSNGGVISRTSGSLAAGSGAGTFTFSGTGTVTGTVGFNNVNIAGGVSFGAASTINGTLTINAGGFVSTNAPSYASGSTLKYNSGGTYGRSTEWAATSGAGYPHHVQISNSTTLNVANGSNNAWQIAGDMIIEANSTMSMEGLTNNSFTVGLTVLGNIANSGNITMGTTTERLKCTNFTNNAVSISTLSSTVGGDLEVTGHLTENGNFNSAQRAVFFTGTGVQDIQGSGTFTIDYIVLNKTSGSVRMLTNLLCGGPNGGNAMTLTSGTDILDLNGNTLTLGTAVVGSTLSGNGLIKGSSTSSISILGDAALGTIRFDQSTPGTTNVLQNFTINRTSTGSLTLGNSLVVNGSLTLTAGTLSVGANTLTINGSVSRTSGTINASAGTLAFGNASTLSLPTSLFTGNILNFNKASGAGTLTVNDNIVVTNNMSTAASTGAFIMAPSKQLTVQGVLNNDGIFTLQNDATFVQSTTGNGIIGSGTFNVEKTLNGNSSTWNATSGRFWYMGVPMNAIARSCFGNYAAGSNRVWSYNEISKQYTDITTDATMLAAGTGYVHRRATNETLTFSATGGNGLFSSDLTLNNLSRTPTSQVGFHLIANPYMAYLDWNAVVANTNTGTSNIEPTFYLRSHNNPGNDISALISYNASNGQYANASSVAISSANDIRYLAPMQAIWVRVGSAASTGNLSITRSMLSHQSSNPGLKSSTIFPTLARVNLVDGARFDQMLVFMNQDMTNGVDQYDSEKMFVSGAPQIYTMAAGKKLVMNGLKNNKKKISVPLYLELPQSKVYQLQLADYNLEDGLILLEDKQEGTIQDFTINDTYAFYANSGVLQNRFVLHFYAPDATITAQGPSNTWVAEEGSYTEGGNIAISSDAKGKVQISLDQPESDKVEGTVQVTDANGRLVHSGALEGLITEFQLNVPSGIYYLTVQSGNLIENKKVFIQE